MAMSSVVISPWCSAAQLRLCTQISIWTYALDNYVERDVVKVTELDDILGRCGLIVRTGSRDHSHPLLSVLSDWQAELMEQPLYPKLSSLWAEKFDRALRGMHYDWTIGRSRAERGGSVSSIEEYLDHAESILAWMVHLPRWVTHGGPAVLEHLDVLVPALDEFAVVVRLANDLATYPWEKDQEGQNNILMYGVTRKWVRTELSAWLEAGRRCLAPLVSANFLPAVELVRFVEWAVAFYALADFRGPEGPHLTDAATVEVAQA
jgi:hypothetical protein